jgi:hypothetical protein
VVSVEGMNLNVDDWHGRPPACRTNCLGERAKVVMLSVTEGDDKPLKYPHMFRAADVVIITKSDLLPHVDFSIGFSPHVVFPRAS